MAETVALGRSKRSTAGNRMRELLEKAHQEDDEELFREVEDDEDFAAPQDARDVFLEDFADTDDEVELDEEEVEKQMRREERRKVKGKGKAVYNPLAPKTAGPSIPKHKALLSTPAHTAPAQIALLDPSIDPDSMAPSTLVLALRKQRRELKRAQRSENRRSNLRASTLRTEEDILEKERQIKENPNRKGRKAMHEGGEVRGVRTMTQDELIAAALEEEERNKESLRDWLRREEERRELRRVGRKRVRGPRWTWVSRTVGKAVEVVDGGFARPEEPLPTPAPGAVPTSNDKTATDVEKAIDLGPSPSRAASDTMDAGPSGPSAATPISIPGLDPAVDPNDPTFPYTRNYLILSQVLGGLPAEFSLILGDHTDWSEVKHVPARNRPQTLKPPICPFTGLPAKYRHPGTGIGYATMEGYKMIEEMLRHEYVWSDAGWVGREDEWVEDMEEWEEAVNGGWRVGERVVREQPGEEDVEMVEESAPEDIIEVEVPSVKVRKKPGPKPKNRAPEGTPLPKGKKVKGGGAVEDQAVAPEDVIASPALPLPKGKGKGKKPK